LSWLFLLAYMCSGFAGLVYEVSWTRLLTLHIGHTTAAASAVVAAFLGGLTAGAAAGGRVAARLTARSALYAYVVLECGVAFAALLLPWVLRALTPFLAWAYGNGAPGLLFPAVRLLSCLVLVFVPAAALGATFPLAIRWFTRQALNPASAGGALYAANTAGAAVGAVLTGFVLIPAIGISGATMIGIAASLIAAGSVTVVARFGDADEVVPATRQSSAAADRSRQKRPRSVTPEPVLTVPWWLGATVLGISGFAALVHEIVWTRILSLLLGPTTYAFAATLAAVIAGVAAGSAIGASLARDSRRAASRLAFALSGAAIATALTGAAAGGWLPRTIAAEAAGSAAPTGLLPPGTWLAAALILPTAMFLGAAFPLALALPRDSTASTAETYSAVYATNTIGNVSGALAAGFLLIPWLGLQTTLSVASGFLVIAAAVALAGSPLRARARLTPAAAAIVAVAAIVVSPAWDRELLASGAYLYAPFVPKTLDLETQLKAGELLYYRDGASATVSVRRITGTTTLAVDGKVDASNRNDMINQKLAAHLPLLLHDQPRDVAIVGLGSGVTAGAALRHPVTRVDVLEISPEVVEASAFFAEENHQALNDPRLHLIVGDGRSHLLLSKRKYDVIVSEPSNPWIAGVAALFTREFFAAVRARLAPNGVVCQWAHTYNISTENLQSIVATFRSVFPEGTLWLVGEADVLLVAGIGPQGEDRAIDDRLPNIASHWKRPGVGPDLAEVGAVDPFAILSLYAAGPPELEQYAGSAVLLTDDRMALEFSGPRDLHRGGGTDNGVMLGALLPKDQGPVTIRDAKTKATAANWRNRAAMMLKADAIGVAYDDYVRSLTIDLSDRAALEGFVKAATLRQSTADALSWITGLAGDKPYPALALTARARLLAKQGLTNDAFEAALQATNLAPGETAAFQTMAELQADAGDQGALERTVATLQKIAPDGAPTLYFASVSAFLGGRIDEAVALANRAVERDPLYEPVYDLLGAAHTKRGDPDRAKQAFLSSLRLDAHDSTAYSNLGLIEAALGNRDLARRYFAEALSLAPESAVARQGLAQLQ
jgi:spermidine synthase